MRLTLLAFAALLAALPAAAADLGEVTSRDAMVPFYQHDQLRLILFGGEIGQKADMLEIGHAMLSLIKPDAPTELVELKRTEPYPIKTPIAQVFDFWKDRIGFSEGMLFTDSARFDRTANLATGSGPVHFRSPAMDIEGTGFSADYTRRKVFIHKDIRIVLRSGKSDIQNAVKRGEVPIENTPILGRSDSMELDLENRLVSLVDNVVVDQGDRIVHCDRMTVRLADPADKSAERANPDDPTGIGQAVPAGEIDEIIFDGNLRIDGKPGAPQRDPWELFDRKDVPVPQSTLLRYYRLHPGKFIPCADETAPAPAGDSRLTSDRCVFAYKQDRITFSGSVKLADRGRTVTCDRMTVKLASDASGKKQLDRIDFQGSVVAADVRGTLYCDHLILTFEPGNDQNSDVPHLSNMFNTGSVRLAEAHGEGNLRFESPDPENPESLRTISAKSGAIYFLADYARFSGTVRAVNGDYILEADDAQFFTVPAQPLAADPGNTTIRQVLIGDQMELKQAVAAGDVVISQTDKKEGLRRVVGDKAVYDVRPQKAVMTGSEKNPPRLLSAGRRMTGKSITVDLATEAIEVEQYLYEKTAD